MPKISVLMPIYNSASSLEMAVNSILNQSYKDLELIAVNDGSKDDSLEILEKVSSLDSRLKVYSKENGGIVSALNYGIDHCNGEFIARMDSDDISKKNRFINQIEHLEFNKLDLIGSNITTFKDSSLIKNEKKYPEGLKLNTHILFNSPFAHPTIFGKSELFQQFRYSNELGIAEDYKFVSDLFINGKRLGNIDKSLLLYRKSLYQLTVSKKQEIAASRLRISENIISKICSSCDEIIFKRISKRCFLGCDTELDLINQLIDGDFLDYDSEVIQYHYFVHCFYAYQSSDFKNVVSKNIKLFYSFLGAKYLSFLLASNVIHRLR
ncbi:Glycosyltransferase involved in cell wall bisynthesis [Marinomonas polaris DSM 16579]|uniref:Glycosyltransferase involved in cell wall bisynthesis n=1 Tax=Marinomonas polaris DSM 16579 TaxID=1122206 RepID=A0A1M5FS29_9GAMM|nr:glycosyltransferase [Marinomonas polaris]SHF94229.1 Glycosyltransferase involved in cell wall bisynthesis [Marinomonas polaris DSM 16579]